MVDPDSEQRVVLGRISGLYGVKGWVKVFSATQPTANILDYSPWYLNLAGQWQAWELQQGKVHGKGIIARLGDCADRDQASLLVGADIAVDRKQLPVLDKDEFYWSDLVGLDVIDQKDVTLGKVDYLLETGANDVLVIQTADRQEILVPYIKGEVIKQVDLDSGFIRIEWDLEY